MTSFAFVAQPLDPRTRPGCGRSAGTTGRVCFDPAGRPDLVDKTGNEVMCSMSCQDLREGATRRAAGCEGNDGA